MGNWGTKRRDTAWGLIVCMLILLDSGEKITGITKTEEGSEEECPEYSYSNETGGNGPQEWGELCPQWVLCRTGHRQSPLDLPSPDPMYMDYYHTNIIYDATRLVSGYEIGLKPLNWSGWKSSLSVLRLSPSSFLLSLLPSNLTLGSNTTIDERKANNRSETNSTSQLLNLGFLFFAGQPFYLTDIAIHVPAEHTIDAQRADAALDFVHQSLPGDYLILSVSLVATSDAPSHPVFQLILDTLSNNNTSSSQAKPSPSPSASSPAATFSTTSAYPIQAPWEEIARLWINPQDLMPKTGLNTSGRAYYMYDGSLTSPPCSENAKRVLMTNSTIISEEQMERLTNLFPFPNARPTQQKTQLIIYYFDPDSPPDAAADPTLYSSFIFSVIIVFSFLAAAAILFHQASPLVFDRLNAPPAPPQYRPSLGLREEI